jgi:serine/threonine protein kinase
MGAVERGRRLEGTAYEIVREIGAGAASVVYEVEHVRLKKRYAAKVLHGIQGNTERKRIECEVQALAAIDHPGVVQVHDFDMTAQGAIYVVMEMLQGNSLRQLVATRGVPPSRALEIVGEVLEALDFAHHRGVAHRSLKPENIFVADRGQGTIVKILDFGIGQVLDDGAPPTRGAKAWAALKYAAPEQKQGKPIGPATDIYAIGVLLSELIAGQPFDDADVGGRASKWSPRLDAVAGVPSQLRLAIARALDPDPAARPSAAALALELRVAEAALLKALDPADDDAVRAEVDELLRHMSVTGPERPAAGRAVRAVADFAVAGRERLASGSAGTPLRDSRSALGEASTELAPEPKGERGRLQLAAGKNCESTPEVRKNRASATGQGSGSEISRWTLPNAGKRSVSMPEAAARQAVTSPRLRSTGGGRSSRASRRAGPSSFPVVIVAASIILASLLVAGAIVYRDYRFRAMIESSPVTARSAALRSSSDALAPLSSLGTTMAVTSPSEGLPASGRPVGAATSSRVDAGDAGDASTWQRAR